MTNLFGLCCLALAFYITAMPEAGQPTVFVVHVQPSEYKVAESLGCVEVLRECQMKKRMNRMEASWTGPKRNTRTR